MGQCHTEAAEDWNIVHSHLMWKHGWRKVMFRACHWEGPCCKLFVLRESPSCFLWSWPVWRSAHIFFSNTWLKGNTIKCLKVTPREVRVWSFPFLFLDASENASGPERHRKDILISLASRLSRVPVTGSALKHPFYISLQWLGPSASSGVQRWNVLGKLWPC